MQTMMMSNKTAVVTGGGAGLGGAVAAALAAQGARVAILGRDHDRLRQAAAAIGPALLPLQCDIADPAQIRAAFGAVHARWGGLDFLVNNAAVYTPFLLEEAEDNVLRGIFDTNVVGAAFCIREAIPLMRAAGGGSIVNISSESVLHPFPYLTVYAASKAALETLSLGLRTELRGEAIRVMTLRVGSMTGNETVARWPPGTLEKFLAAIRATGHADFTGAGIAPETVAACIVDALALPPEASMHLLELRSS